MSLKDKKQEDNDTFDLGDGYAYISNYYLEKDVKKFIKKLAGDELI